MSDRSDREYESRLHSVGPGRYHVGASPFFIQRHPEGDWGVYTVELHGDARIRGAWCFKRLRDARVRAFTYAKEQGYSGSVSGSGRS